MIFIKIILMLALMCSFTFLGSSQPGIKSGSIVPGVSVYKDSIWTVGEGEYQNHHLLHYHETSKQVEKEKLVDNWQDEIFSDSFNRFSRLILYGAYENFDVPTVPLNNIYILEDKKIIVGLSPYTVSPYNIVLYSFEGKLLFKMKFDLLELKVTKGQLKQLLKEYPDLLYCLQQKPQVFKDGEFYHIEMSKCIKCKAGKGLTGIVDGQRYFAGKYRHNEWSHTSQHWAYQTYGGLYYEYNPIYDLIMIGSVPYLLILNGVDGRRVSIPLVSNCDVLKDLDN